MHGLDFGLDQWVVDEQRQRYLHDPDSVDETWRDFFAAPPSPAVPVPRAVPEGRAGAEAAVGAVRVAALVHAYRVRGHLMATVARRTGFGSPESLRRAFARNLDITPGAYRARFGSADTADATGCEPVG